MVLCVLQLLWIILVLLYELNLYRELGIELIELLRQVMIQILKLRFKLLSVQLLPILVSDLASCHISAKSNF